MTELVVSNLCKSFSSSRVLDEIHFVLNTGDILGLIGPNGSGKTTLMESVAGLLPYDVGQIMWDNQPLSHAARRNLLYYMPESTLPYGDQSVRSVVGFFAALYAPASTHLNLILRHLELESVFSKRVKTLSKGFRRRFLIAIALLSPCPILFLDEPFDGLDLKQTISLMDLLKKVRDAGKTFLLAIHQLSDAERVCDRLVLLSGGKTIANGNMGDLRQRAGLPSGRLEEVFLALT